MKRLMILLGAVLLVAVSSLASVWFWSSVNAANAATPTTVVEYAPDPALSAGNGGGWLVTNDGHVQPEGILFSGPGFYGDLSGRGITNIVGMLPTLDGKGYWLVGSDGGVFAFGDAHFLGSIPGSNYPVPETWVGMDHCNSGHGYAVIDQSGGNYQFNCIPFG